MLKLTELISPQAPTFVKLGDGNNANEEMVRSIQSVVLECTNIEAMARMRVMVADNPHSKTPQRPEPRPLGPSSHKMIWLRNYRE